jgi:hypothetical protein
MAIRHTIIIAYLANPKGWYDFAVWQRLDAVEIQELPMAFVGAIAAGSFLD